MAYDNPYNDGPDEEPSSGKDMAGPSEEASEHDDGIVTTIPSNICPGMKPGEEIVLHIDKVTDEEYVVSYSPEKPKDDKKSGDSEPADEPASASMSASESDVYS